MHYKLRCVLLFKGCEIELIKIILPGISSVRLSFGNQLKLVNCRCGNCQDENDILTMTMTFLRLHQNKDPLLIVVIAVGASGGYVVGMLCTHIRQFFGFAEV